MALILIASILLSLPWALIAGEKAPPLLPPDARYKADLLVIVAHPDDDVLIGGYLARASLDEHRRIAVIYCTSGDGGGNAVGYEAGAALGQLRILEARRALASLGIENAWFLDGHDTPGQDVLWSLDRWNHGRALDQIVRLVRITRPEVILTFLPDYVAGENHADHQAAGVLATEAFDAAGDPTQFPEQVSPPRNRTGMMNLTEGLHVWQPKKLYYFTDAFENDTPYWHAAEYASPFRKNLLDSHGPVYLNTAISPARHVSYARLNAVQQSLYRTQEGYLGIQALAKNDFGNFEYPVRFLFGKSVVGGSVTGDIFEGVKPGPIPFVAVRGFHPLSIEGVSFQLAGPWLFYRRFWKAHELGSIAALLPVAEASIKGGQLLHIPLAIRNETAGPVDVTVQAVLPAGWSDNTRYEVYPVPRGESYPVLELVTAPSGIRPQWQEISFRASAGTRELGRVAVRVFVGKSGGLPQ